MNTAMCHKIRLERGKHQWFTKAFRDRDYEIDLERLLDDREGSSTSVAFVSDTVIIANKLP